MIGPWPLSGLLGRTLLVLLEDQLHARGINLHILTGTRAGIHRPDSATIAHKMLFMVAAMAAEMERKLIREHTLDGLRAAEAQDRGWAWLCWFSCLCVRRPPCGVASRCRARRRSSVLARRWWLPAQVVAGPGNAWALRAHQSANVRGSHPSRRCTVSLRTPTVSARISVSPSMRASASACGAPWG